MLVSTMGGLSSTDLEIWKYELTIFKKLFRRTTPNDGLLFVVIDKLYPRYVLVFAKHDTSIAVVTVCGCSTTSGVFSVWPNYFERWCAFLCRFTGVELDYISCKARDIRVGA